MDCERIAEGPSWSDARGQVMKTPDDVATMLRLKAGDWGIKRIARELGCSHRTGEQVTNCSPPWRRLQQVIDPTTKLDSARLCASHLTFAKLMLF
jgi:hypothetical protein